MSTLKKYLQDHALPLVALGLLALSRVQKGLQKFSRGPDAFAQWLPMLAPMALEILDLVEGLQQSVEFHKPYPDLNLRRAAIAIITAYMLFNRGECGACDVQGDPVVYDNFVTMLLRREKGKSLGAGLVNVR